MWTITYGLEGSRRSNGSTSGSSYIVAPADSSRDGGWQSLRTFWGKTRAQPNVSTRPRDPGLVGSVPRRGRARQADVHPHSRRGVLLGVDLGQPVEPARRSIPRPPGGYGAIHLLQQRVTALKSAYHDGLRVLLAQLPGALFRN
jgi:hypothetical protein